MSKRDGMTKGMAAWVAAHNAWVAEHGRQPSVRDIDTAVGRGSAGWRREKARGLADGWLHLERDGRITVLRHAEGVIQPRRGGPDPWQDLPYPQHEDAQDLVALAVEWGGLELRLIGDAMGITRERVRQIEVSALRKVRAAAPELHAHLMDRRADGEVV